MASQMNIPISWPGQASNFAIFRRNDNMLVTVLAQYSALEKSWVIRGALDVDLAGQRVLLQSLEKLVASGEESHGWRREGVSRSCDRTDPVDLDLRSINLSARETLNLKESLIGKKGVT